ncbi:MAG: DUF4097 family beta strand repeat protein [Phycisphaeraceae bacterium]|nr:DUF4097 family beta strand repeat protein [Phycisphaeraceae bacterium]
MRMTSLTGLVGASVLLFASAPSADKITETRELKVATAPGLPLTVKTSNGSIEVIPTDSSELRIKATVYAKHKERLEAVRISASNDPATGNDIRVDFPESAQGEGCSLVIEVPGAKNVNLSASNGALSIRGTAGIASLDTSNGGVVVKDHDGDATVRTSNGAVTVASLSGRVSITSSNGPVQLSGSAHPFQIQTTNGPVTVGFDRAFSGVVSIATSNGTISAPNSAKVLSDSGNKGWDEATMKISIGEGTETSSIRTTNAPVKIRSAAD